MVTPRVSFVTEGTKLPTRIRAKQAEPFNVDNGAGVC